MKDKPEFNVFVFSLPRCGSSMMTGIIEQLGVNMVYTSEDEAEVARRKENYQKRLGKYVPNESFYEITQNQWECWQKVCETPYAGCKVIIPVNGMRWEAVVSKPAKVIMMRRDPEEIRQSQEAFYKKARVPMPGEDDDPAEMARAYLRTMIAQTEVMLQTRKDASNNARFGNGDVPPFDFMVVDYRSVLEETEKKIGEVARFIEAPNDIWNAVHTVDPSKIRFKGEELDEDI